MALNATRPGQTAAPRTRPLRLLEMGPSGLDINPNTETLYVANQSDNTVSVIDASACNQHQLAGCNQTWQTAPVGSGPFRLSVNKTTNSIYVAGFDHNSFHHQRRDLQCRGEFELQSATAITSNRHLSERSGHR